MPEFNIEQIISDYVDAEKALIRLLEENGSDQEISIADEKLSLLFNRILASDLPTSELIELRVKFLLSRIITEDVEAESMAERIKSSILDDVHFLAEKTKFGTL